MYRGISKVALAVALVVCVIAAFGCSGSSHNSKSIAVTISNKTTSVAAGSSTTFTATVTNDTADEGVTWTIAPSNGAGTISAVSTTSVTYNAPATPPATNSVTITATSVADITKSDSVTFSITAKTPPAISVSITNKISTITAGAAAVTLDATVTNDSANAGVSWTLTAAGAACSPACGTITQATTTTVLYTPPATAPSAPNNTPSITATSVTDKTKSDSDAITIQAPVAAIAVSITNKISTINAGAAAVTLNATVTNDSANAGVSWTLTAAGTACSPACGTISNATTTSVLFTPPATAPSAPNNTPTVTATSITDKTKSDSDAITIQAAAQTGITVSITNKFSTIVAGAPNVTINVTVTNDPKNDGVIWTLTAGGADCTPTCGTLISNDQFSVVYVPPTAPGAAPANAPTLTATSFTDSTKSDSFTFTITPAPANLGLLKGRYVAVLQGADAKLNPRAMGITFTSDGSGRITEFGVDLNEDYNVSDLEGPIQARYTVDTSFENSIRGQISFPTISLPAFPGDTTGSPLGLVFVLAADGKSGDIEERDAGLSVISGKLYQQDSTAFSLNSLEGDFAFGAATAFNGNQSSNNNWQAMVGRLTYSNEEAAFENALIDTSVAQTGPGVTNATLAGQWTTVDSDGRMGMYTFVSAASPSQMTFEAYVVNASKVLFLELDTAQSGATTMFAGSATRQSTLSASSLNGASVFWANGQENIADMGSSAAAGRFVFTNGTSANVQYDRSYDESGAPASNSGASLPVTLDTTSGRATITFSGGGAKLLFDSAVLYVCDTNSGYLLDTTTSSKAEALFGQFVPQAAGPFDSTYLSGNLLAMQGGYESRDFAQFFGGFIVSSPSGAYDTFDYYQDKTGTIQIGSDVSDTTNVLGNINATTGRGTGRFDWTGNQCSNDAVCSTAFYLIGKNQAVMVNQPAAPPSTQEDSSITFLDPQ